MAKMNPTNNGNSSGPVTRVARPEPGNGGVIKTTQVPARATHAGPAQTAAGNKKK